MKEARESQLRNRVKSFRQQQGWSQEELARRAGISRAAVSAIEVERLVPSVAAALALAAALGVRVESLFGAMPTTQAEAMWAWPPAVEPCRFWQARVAGRLVLFPVELTAAGVVAHDGVYRHGALNVNGSIAPENTLVMASCDPAASLLADHFARASGFRLLVLQRSSAQALELLRQGLVDAAGVHLAATQDRQGNEQAVRSVLGPGYSLLKVAAWQEGLALGAGITATTTASLLRSHPRWIGREAGSGARQCQDELLPSRPQPRRLARDHRGVAEAIRCGWAEVGVCVRIACEEAGLRFLPLRDEAYDLCFAANQEDDPRIRALVTAVRSASYRTWLSELPGYDATPAGEVICIR